MVVLVTCHAGAGSPPSSLYVFRATSYGRVSIAFPLLSPAAGYGASSFKVHGATVAMRVYGYSSASIPSCCPDVIQAFKWRWTGASFTRSSTTIRSPASSPLSGVNGNPWGYNFRCCHRIYQAQTPSSFCSSYFTCEGAFFSEPGYIVECVDETYGHAGGLRGSCSDHGGNLRPLLRP